MIESIIKTLFPVTYEIIKLQGRGDGFIAHEALVFERAKETSKEAYDLVLRLMQ
jgi:hypothetical protein